MDYLWVLDFNAGRVYLYDIKHDARDAEEIIDANGHQLSNCQWMTCDEDKPVREEQ